MGEIRQAAKKDRQQWDEYVLSCPQASPYHLWAWKEAVELAYGHKTFYLVAEEAGCIVGVLPLVNIRCPLLVNELVSLPFCDVGNCLADTAALEKELVAKAAQIAAQQGCKELQLRGSLILYEQKNCELHPMMTGKVRMILPVPESSEQLLASFKSKLRSQVRKAEKNGVEFRWVGVEGVPAFYDVYARNMRDLGSPAHSKRWFEKVMEQFGARARIGLAEYEGKCIGAGLILSTDKQTAIPWASTLREHNRLAPNMLLYWNFLKFSADSGIESFDFGRSTEGEGTFRFKKQWGAKPIPLEWFSSLAKQGAESRPQRKRELVEKIWQRLPLLLANKAGPALRKYISL